MKKNYLITSIFLVVSVCSSLLHAQAFKKGALLVSVSEGGTNVNYITNDAGNSENPTNSIHHCFIHGTRDPLIIEYGLSNRWGIGITSGKDLFKTTADFYGFKLSDNKKINVASSEFTVDGSYHFLVNKRLDLSATASFGIYSVAFKVKDSDALNYSYTANGGIVRVGVRARYYFYKRFGAFGMLSIYSGNASPKDVKGNTIATNYTTTISGNAIEVGLCYRFIK